MKYRLEREGDWVEVVRFGRVVTVSRADGRSEDEGHFDERAAEEALSVRVDALLSEGFVESAETVAKREELAAAKRARDEARARHEAWAAAADPRAAFRSATAEQFAEAEPKDVDALLAFVTRLEAASEAGFRVVLSTGGAIEWSPGALWLYPDAEALAQNEHAVHFGPDAGPPEPPDDLADVDWFLQTWPNEKYFFTRASAPWVAHAWELDGGLVEDGRAPGQVLVSELSFSLRERGEGP